VRFYGILKIPAQYDRDTTSAKFKDMSRHLPASLLGVSACIFQTSLVGESEMIMTQMGRTIDHKMAAVHGAVCTIPPRNSNQWYISGLTEVQTSVT
jgi:hypothetical protein